MTDYISRDTAVNGLAKIINKSDMPVEWNNGMSAAMLALFRIPAADVVPVVMCCECKHYRGVHNCRGHAPCDYWEIGNVLWNDFCSRGVKMEES